MISDKLSVENIVSIHYDSNVWHQCIVGFLGSKGINIFIYLKNLGCVFSKHVLHPELKVFLKRISIANSIVHVIM